MTAPRAKPLACAVQRAARPERGLVGGDWLKAAEKQGDDFCRFLTVSRWFHARAAEDVPVYSRSPNLNAYAERFVRTIKDECLNELILGGERQLRHVLKEFAAHYHHERNHQGRDYEILVPDERLNGEGLIVRHQRLGGLLNFYHREENHREENAA